MKNLNCSFGTNSIMLLQFITVSVFYEEKFARFLWALRFLPGIKSLYFPTSRKCLFVCQNWRLASLTEAPEGVLMCLPLSNFRLELLKGFEWANWRGTRQAWCTLYYKYAVIWIVRSVALIYRVEACQDIWSLLRLKTQLVKTCLSSIFFRIQFQNLHNKQPVASGTPPGSILADWH